jgi:hypothetical protein
MKTKTHKKRKTNMKDLTGINYPNKDDYQNSFWNNDYRILVTAQGFEFVVNADCTQDAIDYVIGYCEEHFPHFLMSRIEQENIEHYNDYISGGNHHRYFNTYNIHIKRL